MYHQCVNLAARSQTALVSGVAVLRRIYGRNRASINGKVFTASLLLAGLTVLCKFAAAGREVTTAYFLGTGDAMDAMVVALMVPTLLIAMLAGAAGTALLPTLAHVQQHSGHASAERLLRTYTFWALVLLIPTVTLVALASPWLIKLCSPGFSLAKQQLACRLLWWLLPIIVLQGLAALWSAVLHSQERFAATGLVPGITPLVAMGLLLALGHRWGVYALAAGTLLGTLGEASVLGWALHRIGYRIWPQWGPVTGHLRHVARQYLPLVAAATLMGSTTIIDNAMASWFGGGSVATLSYGRRIVALAMSIPILSFSKAIFPYFSKLVTLGDWQQVRCTLSTYRKAILWGTCPLAIGMILLAKPLTAFALQHGAFNANSTEAVAWVQSMYALQIPVYAVGILYVRLISSMQANHLLTVITVISIVLNVVLNCILMQWMGLAGIALSTSLVYTASCSCLVAMGNKMLKLQEQALMTS